MATESHIAQLIAQWLRKDITPAGLAELEAWRNASPANNAFLEKKVRPEVIIEALRDGHRINKEDTWKKFEELRDEFIHSHDAGSVVRSYRWIAVAAVFIALVGIGLYLGRTFQNMEPTKITNRAPVTGGRLILSDGSAIGISKVSEERMLRQGSMVVRIDSSQLVYETELLNDFGIQDLLLRVPDLSYNIVHVPYGAQYRVLLSDGTAVQLNAGSVLRYPLSAGGRRIVELTGEAYFDVRRNAQHPFIVQTGQQQTEVLGTQFAVRNYPGEPIQTVILQQGKVRVRGAERIVELHPGQEALINQVGMIRVKDFDPDKALCWKDGYFNFDEMDLRAAVCQLAQWYGMKVRIEKDVREKSLGVGNITQGIPLSQLLQLLELPNLHFEIHDSTIIVKK